MFILLYTMWDYYYKQDQELLVVRHVADEHTLHHLQHAHTVFCFSSVATSKIHHPHSSPPQCPVGSLLFNSIHSSHVAIVSVKSKAKTVESLCIRKAAKMMYNNKWERGGSLPIKWFWLGTNYWIDDAFQS